MDDSTTGNEDARTIERLRRAAGGESEELDALFVHHRPRLLRMVELRLDQRLRTRVDASDVLQETFVEALRRLPDYVARPDMPFFLWLRFLAGQKVVALRRHHLGVQARDAQREQHAGTRPPRADPESMTAVLVDTHTSPSAAAMRDELREKLLATLERMEANDREILSLRHLEQLTNTEAARELGLDESTASKRYVRALAKLRAILGSGDPEPS